jgi:fucose 4-O-acetylase-like acetyltransferase
VGFLLLSDGARKLGETTFVLAGASGVGLIYLARWLDARPRQVYAVYDFWHTSPNFFLIRVGLLLVILAAAYSWCRRGPGQWGFSSFLQLGQTSLLVYWVHIEFVYGRLSILPKRAVDIRTASVGLLAIFLSMVLLSMLRSRFKGRGAEALARFHRPVKTG